MGDILSPDVRAFVEELIADGRCKDIPDAVNTALRRWREEESCPPWTDERLREEVAIGIDQAHRGEFVEFTAEDIICEGHERLRRKRS